MEFVASQRRWNSQVLTAVSAIFLGLSLAVGSELGGESREKPELGEDRLSEQAGAVQPVDDDPTRTEEVSIAVLGADNGSSAVAARRPSELPVPNFVLPDTDGELVGLSDFGDREVVVVVYIGTQCPIGNAYVPILMEIQDAYSRDEVQLIGINANPSDSADEVATHAEEYGITFPVLVDVEQTSISLLNAERTCEAFVLDRRRVVRYRGRIDDRIGYSVRKEEPSRHDLRAAIDEVLSGDHVTVPTTETAGCKITRRGVQSQLGNVTYHGQIDALLRQHCVECHHPGTAAPFALESYDDVANWSAMIREVVEQRRMPPWHADPRFGKFSNERRLSQSEIDILVAWTEDGSPEGTPSTGDEEVENSNAGDDRNFDLERLASAVDRQHTADGWRIGKPDLVFDMPEEFHVPASGVVDYKYFVTPIDIEDDIWIAAAEARPGNRSVVHHIIVYYRMPGDDQKLTWVTATAPGADPLIFPKGYGRRIPKGAELVWQLHYTTNGKAEVDRSQVGLVLADQLPNHELTTYGIANGDFVIPPGEKHHEVVASIPVRRNAVVTSLFPHMHLRGKDFRYEAVYPNGKRETLLSIPQYDFNWQHTYRLAEPLRLPRGSRIVCTAHFDNSTENPANPDPTIEVRFGEQTWDEMMIGYIDYYYED